MLTIVKCNLVNAGVSLGMTASWFGCFSVPQWFKAAYIHSLAGIHKDIMCTLPLFLKYDQITHSGGKLPAAAITHRDYHVNMYRTLKQFQIISFNLPASPFIRLHIYDKTVWIQLIHTLWASFSFRFDSHSLFISLKILWLKRSREIQWNDSAGETTIMAKSHRL